MRIMILHMRFHPDLTGTGPLVTDLATDLVNKGKGCRIVPVTCFSCKGLCLGKKNIGIPEYYPIIT